MENHRQIQARHAARIANEIRDLWQTLAVIVREHKNVSIPEPEKCAKWMLQYPTGKLVDRFPLDLVPVKNYLEKCNECLARIQAGALDSQDHNYQIQMARRHFNSARKVIWQVTDAYPELIDQFAPINEQLQSVWSGTVKRVH